MTLSPIYADWTGDEEIRLPPARSLHSNVFTGSSTTITEVPVQLRRRKRPALGIALIDLHDP